MMEPQPLDNNHWHWRWIYCAADKYRRLHRIAQPFDVTALEGWECQPGTAVCGLKGDDYRMPGMMSRMGRPRCIKCCEAVGVPKGDGSPYNDNTLTKEQREA